MFLKDIFDETPSLTLLLPHQDGSLFLAHHPSNLDLVHLIQDFHAPTLTNPHTLMSIGPDLNQILLANAPPTHLHDQPLLPPPNPSPLAPWLACHSPPYQSVASTLLQHVHYLYQATALTHSLFPTLFEHLDLTLMDWQTILTDLLYEVETQDWFPVDWLRLNNEFSLHLYLDFMPVRCFGLNSLLLDTFPFLLLFLSLLRPEFNLLASDFETYGLTLDPDMLDKWLLADVVSKLDFSAYPLPLCWLGAVFKIVLADTGNLILDTVIEPYDPTPDHFFFSWHRHLPQVKRDWQIAKDTVEQLDAFFEWCEFHYPYDWLHTAFQIILEAGGYDVF